MEIENAEFEIPMQFPCALASRMQFREDASDASWNAWEYKTLNIHRGVLIWHPGSQNLTYEEMSRQILERVRATFRVSSWRGFAFGVFIDAMHLPDDLHAIDSTIQTRALWGPIWQWTVYACASHGVAVGVHTWTEGYLSPVFRAILDDYRRIGFAVGSFKKDKDQLMRFLTAMHPNQFPKYQK